MVRHFRELRVYQQAFKAAQEIYALSKSWPKEERYALTDQIRRASRSVCANIAEAWRKRRYERHFVSKLSDADADAAETQVWLDFTVDAGLISSEQYQSLNQRYETIIGGLVKMMAKPTSWCAPSSLIKEEEVPYKL
ncbi:MAG TPA: four helix bundle protein [Rhodothermales bacterium]|nr:four helix bundle protein [Rhodothermales bacterium]